MITIKYSNQEIKAYTNVYNQDGMIKEISGMQKQLGPYINGIKSIAKHKKDKKPKKGEIQERIVEQNDQYVNGLYSKEDQNHNLLIKTNQIKHKIFNINKSKKYNNYYLC